MRGRRRGPRLQPRPTRRVSAGAAARAAIDLPALTTVLEGKHRPGHFKGVCQVVAKLFNIVTPQRRLLRAEGLSAAPRLTAMVEALDLPIDIVPCPTLREPDGLAMSSRNQYLSADERAARLVDLAGLSLAHDEVSKGITQTNRLSTLVQSTILAGKLQCRSRSMMSRPWTPSSSSRKTLSMAAC